MINYVSFIQYLGEYRVVNEEGGSGTGGGKTKHRLKNELTAHINLIDNRGMQDFGSHNINDVMAQVREYIH